MAKATAFERLKAAATGLDPDQLALVERTAMAARAAHAEHTGIKLLVPWRKAKSREAWRVVAAAVLKEAKQ